MNQSKELKINIFEKIGTSTAVSSESGDAIFNSIKNGLQNGAVITLDFLNIDLLTSAFLNGAIGQLYSEFTGDQLNKSLKIKNMKPEDTQILKKVISRAKEYFKDRGNIDSAIKDALNDE